MRPPDFFKLIANFFVIFDAWNGLTRMLYTTTIECPKHNGQFDYRTGEAKRVPVCVNLKTYAVKVEGNRVCIQVA